MISEPVQAPVVTQQSEPQIRSVPAPEPITVSETGEDLIETLERLGALKEKGYITDEEFAGKKSEILSRL